MPCIQIFERSRELHRPPGGRCAGPMSRSPMALTTPHLQARRRWYNCDRLRVTAGTRHRSSAPDVVLGDHALLNAEGTVRGPTLPRPSGEQKHGLADNDANRPWPGEHRDLLTGIVMDETIGGKPRKGTKADGLGRLRPSRAVDQNGSRCRCGERRKGDGQGREKDKMKGRHMRALSAICVDTSEVSRSRTSTRRTWASRRFAARRIKHQAGTLTATSTRTPSRASGRCSRSVVSQCEPSPPQRYVDEFCYRYNLRNAEPLAAFDLTINRGLGVAQ